MTLLPQSLLDAALAVVEHHRRHGTMVTTAESCTGGLVSAAITSIAGSSAVLERGFVTYSNQAKTDMLGIAPSLIAAHGAVSAEIASAMARGALAGSQADCSVAITGIAGPGGGSADKPVGLVHFALAHRRNGHLESHHRIFSGNRDEVRLAAALAALGLLMSETP